jgi:hypothetical protein
MRHHRNRSPCAERALASAPAFHLKLFLGVEPPEFLVVHLGALVLSRI